MQNQINLTFGKKALTELPNKLKDRAYSSLFILVDEHTQSCCLEPFLNQTRLTDVQVLTMGAGEENKQLETCEKLWHQLSELGADRNSALLNLGGGVVTDLGGFVACTFKRGIDFYNIPTSLLAMVDASLGGKTGIDLGLLKNQIGVIEEPQEVIIYSQWLQTLPEVEIRSGFAEMLKHGLIANLGYWQELLKLTTLDANSLAPFIESSIAVKKEVVEIDPKERGLRKILNYGHTLGHAIESYFLTHPHKKRLLHGEAIAVGMVLEAFLSIHCCDLKPTDAAAIKAGFKRYYPLVSFSNEDVNAILNLLRHDKKNKAGRVNFVLLKSIGQPQMDVEVPQELFLKAFEYYSAP
jgi:3-dehydroquinate synthase